VTFVYPEEERLLFALSHVLAPASSVALGSFYGYAAVWLLPGIVAAGGVLSLVDVDPDAMALAEANVDALGYRDHARFEIADATRWTATEQVDLCFLDAEGPKDGVSPDLRDKAVYGPVLEQAAAKIRPGGLLVAHNVLEDDLPRTRFLSERVRSYRDQQRRFRAELERSFDRTAVLATTEGMGVYRRGRDC
jgi:predicted O-methyltransferase YrrM